MVYRSVSCASPSYRYDFESLCIVPSVGYVGYRTVNNFDTISISITINRRKLSASTAKLTREGVVSSLCEPQRPPPAREGGPLEAPPELKKWGIFALFPIKIYTLVINWATTPGRV